MPDKKTAASAAGEGVATAKAEPRFTVERLRVDCLKLFGVTRSTYDGATAGATGTFTVAQMKDRIDKWLGKPVGPVKTTRKEGK